MYRASRYDVQRGRQMASSRSSTPLETTCECNCEPLDDSPLPGGVIRRGRGITCPDRSYHLISELLGERLDDIGLFHTVTQLAVSGEHNRVEFAELAEVRAKRSGLSQVDRRVQEVSQEFPAMSDSR